MNTCDNSNGPGAVCNYTNLDWTDILALVAQLETALLSDPTNELLIDQLAHANFDKSKILRCLLDDAINSENLTFAYQLLDQEGSIHSQRVKYGIMLNDGDVYGATTQLNSVSTLTLDDQYFKQVQDINLDRISSNSNYSLSASDEALLTSIGLSQTISSSYARSLLALLKDIRLPLGFPLAPNNGAKRKANTKNVKSVFRIEKNPVMDVLTILSERNTAQAYNLKIIDLNGYVFYQDVLNKGIIKEEIEISLFKPSIYFISIFNDKGMPIYKSKFVKL